jgi:hypothetical protein
MLPPTEEEVAAIVAAVEATRPVPAADEPAAPVTPLWRFSARWWRKPIASRRDRPR